MSYATTTQLLGVVLPGGATPTRQDSERAQTYLDSAAAAIDFYCGRSFSPPAADPTARRCDAVPNQLLYIDDLLPDPEPEIVVDGITLLAGVNFMALLGPGLRSYDRVLCLGHLWSDLAAGLRYGAVVISGKWAFATTVPPAVVQAEIEVAAQMWQSAAILFAEQGGAISIGVAAGPPLYLSGRQKQLLAPYARRRPAQVVGRS